MPPYTHHTYTRTRIHTRTNTLTKICTPAGGDGVEVLLRLRRQDTPRGVFRVSHWWLLAPLGPANPDCILPAAAVAHPLRPTPCVCV